MNLDKCRSATTVSKIKVEELGRKATFQNGPRETFWSTQVDGCLVVNSVAADYVVSKEGVGDVVVELKGKDVRHGTEQIFATASLWTTSKFRMGGIAGLIVARQYPRVSSQVQRAQQRFSRVFRGPLHVVTSNREYEFTRVLSYDGPS